ncbi:MAG TPA: SGNH/GDSL hydrolase family protein [Casimicrobiaceae bacterium]|nr:SGNH/GDSL hydrolase family protein [Casimicrobiaceae bacterium]
MALLERLQTARPSPVDVGTSLLIASTVFLLRWRHLQRHVAVGEALADVARPFEREVPQARRRVLVVGDSIGVGTGAERAHESIAGRLAADFPDVAIVNRARNGAKTRDACVQVAEFEGERFDIILIHVGANDIFRRTPLSRLAADVDELLARASRVGTHVLVTTTPNVGLAPAFFAPISWWLTRRSRQVRDLFSRAARRHGAHYANFFHPRSCDPFSREWQRYYAADRVHPSSECYGYVHRALLRATPLAHWLAEASAPSDLGADVDELGEERDVEGLAKEAHAR